MKNYWSIIKNKKNWFKIVGILFFLGLIYIRFSWFDQHFTHYDDIKVDQLTNYQANAFEVKFGQLRYAGGISEELYNLFYLLFGKAFNVFYNAINFSRYWTYAPAQFIFTFALLPFGKDYTSIKFFGRFPSLIFGCIALIVIWKVVYKVTQSKAVAYFGTAILGFSWQAILYCMHMSNYESIILCGGCFSLYILSSYEKDSTRKWVLDGIILGIMTWFHYQVVCFLGGYIFAVLILKLLRKEKIKNIFWGICQIAIGYSVIIWPLFLFANMDGKPTWNAGVNGEFLYNFSWNIGYTLKFFVVNSYKVFKAMLSPVPLYLPLSNTIVIILGIFFILGIIKSIGEYRSINERFLISLFCTGTIATEYFFVFLGKFTLSPTRHCNVLIPVYIIEICLGLFYFVNFVFLRKPRFILIVPYVFCILMGIAWGKYGKVIKNERVDMFSSDLVANILNQTSPDLVIDRSAPQLWYLLDKAEYPRRQIIDYQTDFYDKDDDIYNNHRILIVSHTSKIDNDVLDSLASQLVEYGYMEQVDAEKLKNSECSIKYEKMGKLDFDFYNVTNGAANNLFYYLYEIK